MSDTVKLIIEMPKEGYEWIQTHRNTDYQTTQMLYKRVRNATPLDDVLEKIRTEIKFEVDHRTNMLCAEDVLEILDNIGSEDKPNETDN